MIRELAIQLRARATSATGEEREELLYLAAEYDALAELSFSLDPAAPFAVMLPK